MRFIPLAVACAALCVPAGRARAADEQDQAAKDRAFEQAAATEAADARAAGLPLTSSTQAGLAEMAERREAAVPRHFGLLLEGGFPEGATASLVYRPVSEIRLWAGPAWNYIAWGVQGGVTVVPWQMGISPLLSVEVGRYFSADARFLARNASGIPEELKPLLANVGYDYAAAHVGIEIGARNSYAISLRAGLSYLSLEAKGTHTTTATTNGTTATVAFTDPRLRGTIPSVKLGVQLWF